MSATRQPFFGADAQAWTRLGLNELREAFNPSRESIAQPTPLGLWGHPTPGEVDRSGPERTYTLDELRGLDRQDGHEKQAHVQDGPEKDLDRGGLER